MEDSPSSDATSSSSSDCVPSLAFIFERLRLLREAAAGLDEREELLLAVLLPEEELLPDELLLADDDDPFPETPPPPPRPIVLPGDMNRLHNFRDSRYLFHTSRQNESGTCSRHADLNRRYDFGVRNSRESNLTRTNPLS